MWDGRYIGLREKMRKGVQAKGTGTFHEAFVSSSLLVIAGERCMLASLKEERVSHSLSLSLHQHHSTVCDNSVCMGATATP